MEQLFFKEKVGMVGDMVVLVQEQVEKVEVPLEHLELVVAMVVTAV